jgi:hypothetical protein
MCAGVVATAGAGRAVGERGVAASGAGPAWHLTVNRALAASKDGFEEALDCACGLYLNDPSAWSNPRHHQAPGPKLPGPVPGREVRRR